MAVPIGDLGDCCGCGGCRWAKVRAYRVVPGTYPVHTWAQTESPIIFGHGGVWDSSTLDKITQWFLPASDANNGVGGGDPLFSHPAAMDSRLNHGDPTQQKRYRKATWTCTGSGSGSGWTRTYDSGRVVQWDENTGIINYVRDWSNDSVTVDGVTTANDYERVWSLTAEGVDTTTITGEHHGSERPDVRGIPWLKDYIDAWEPAGYARATYTASENEITLQYEQAMPASGLGDFDVTYHILLETPKTCAEALVEAEAMLDLVDFSQFGIEPYDWPLIDDPPPFYQWPETAPMQWFQHAVLGWQRQSSGVPATLVWRRFTPLVTEWKYRFSTAPDEQPFGIREELHPTTWSRQDDHPFLERFWTPDYDWVIASKILIDPNGTSTSFGICYVANEDGPLDTLDEQYWIWHGWPGFTGERKCTKVDATPAPTNVTVHTVDGRTLYEVRWKPSDYTYGVGEIFWGCTSGVRFPDIPSCCHETPPIEPFNADATTITADSTDRHADETGI